MKDGRNTALRTQLQKLRIGPGVTLAKLAASDAVLEALGTDDPVLARLMLDALLQDGTVYAKALRSAYNLDPPGYPVLLERQHEFLRSLDPPKYDVATAQRYENAMIDELVLTLMSEHFRETRAALSAGKEPTRHPLIGEPVQREVIMEHFIDFMIEKLREQSEQG